MFNSQEASACRRLVELALEEDLGQAGDLTSQAIIPAGLPGQAVFVARAEGVLAGLPAAALVLDAVDSSLHFEPLVEDGALVRPEERLAVVSGPMRSILAAERTALNFLQRLSGIASLTRQYVQAVTGLPARILDTRKTTPGWRLLEKYAVRCGGGHNHRLGLHDGMLIKDNHLAALDTTGGNTPGAAIARAVQLARSRAGEGVIVEVEVDNLAQLDEALACRPTIILLDNMTPADLRAAVQRRNAVGPAILLEASGGVNLANVRAIAETGVDRISVGALTHSATALDIALDFLNSSMC